MEKPKMIRRKLKTTKIKIIPEDNRSLSAGDVWNNEALKLRYISELETKYKESISNKKKKLQKPQKCATRSIYPPTLKTKPVRNIPSLRCKTRPNSSCSLKKPNYLVYQEHPSRASVNVATNETEIFFKIVQQTVADVVESKLTELVKGQFKIIMKQLEELSRKVQKKEEDFTSLCEDINNKFKFYGEETGRHFRYICMKLEYDKLFYQHMNGMLKPEAQTRGGCCCSQSLLQDLTSNLPLSQRPCGCVSTPIPSRTRTNNIPDKQKTENQPSEIVIHHSQSNFDEQENSQISSMESDTTDNLERRSSVINPNSETSLKTILASLQEFNYDKKRTKKLTRRCQRNREIQVEMNDDEHKRIEHEEKKVNNIPKISNLFMH